MAVVKIGSTHISACGWASNAISNHNTTFSGSGNSLAPLPTLPHHNGSRNSRWRSSKPEVPIFQLVEELATRFQIIIPRFHPYWMYSCEKGAYSRYDHVTTLCRSRVIRTYVIMAAILNYNFQWAVTMLGVGSLNCPTSKTRYYDLNSSSTRQNIDTSDLALWIALSSRVQVES